MSEKTFRITTAMEIDLPEGARVDDAGTGIILADGRRLSAFMAFDVQVADGIYVKADDLNIGIAYGDLEVQVQEAEYGN